MHDRLVQRAQVQLLVMIAEVGPRNAVVLLNDGLMHRL
jgi:hypothetical protein